MKSCSMHPTRTAHWHCPKCSRDYCRECVIKQEGGPLTGGRLLRSCPKCLAETSWIGAETVIKPFWERLPRFFVYPLTPGTVIYMAILALGGLVFRNWMVQFICWVLLLNYAYVALKNTASGNLNPPRVDEMISGDFLGVVLPVVKQAVLVFVLILLGVFVAGRTGIFGGLVYLVLVMFLLPSMIIVLVNTESLLTALNPAAFLALPFKIGKAYFIMFVFLAILFFAPGALLQWLLPYLPVWLGAYMMSFAENYYTVISYHLMGYVLLQYHETLGYEMDADDIRDASRREPEFPDEPAVREAKMVDVLCREGELESAVEHIRQWHSQGGEFTADLARQYFQLLKNKNDASGMLEHAPEYLDLAVAEGRKDEALEVYDTCRKIDRNFSVNPPALFKIGEWMAEAGRFKDALKIFSRLIKRFPEADEVPLSYFRLAQLYYDRLMDADRARKIMRALVKKFPDHEMNPKFQNYLEYLGGV
ncbi:MAG: tetratricopeptide repeat protein [Desulfobacteraceae bacterium]|nr:tetratricopeptide repeat protein [Desulfobacteraceae bacterium]